MFLGGVATAVFWLCMSCAAVSLIYAMPLFGMRSPPHPVEDMTLLYLLATSGCTS